MNDCVDRWTAVLAAAAGTGLGGPSADLGRAAQRLRLVWATGAAVRAATADDELWWLRLAETIAAAADDLELIPTAPTVAFGAGSGPFPAGTLPDTAALRRSVCNLLIVVQQALLSYAAQQRSAAATLAAAVAYRSAGQAVEAARDT